MTSGSSVSTGLVSALSIAGLLALGSIFAPAGIEEQVRGLYISSLVSMGKEDHAQAESFIDQGLAIHTAHQDLLQLRRVLSATMTARMSR